MRFPMLQQFNCFRSVIATLFITACGTAAQCHSGSISDSLRIEGYYTYRSEELNRPKLEKMLRGSECSEEYATAARNYRYGSNGIGVALWGVSITIAAVQIKSVVDAIEKETPITDPLGRSAIPLWIGGEVSSFISGMLRSRSDYLLYKAASVYNENILTDSMMSRDIEKVKNGWYRQGALRMPEHVCIRVLKEYEEPRGFVKASQVLEGTGTLFSTVGAWLLFYGVMGFIEPEDVDIPTRNVQLGVGIGLTCSSLFTSCISSWLQKKAITAYNLAVNSSSSERN